MLTYMVIALAVCTGLISSCVRQRRVVCQMWKLRLPGVVHRNRSGGRDSGLPAHPPQQTGPLQQLAQPQPPQRAAELLASCSIDDLQYLSELTLAFTVRLRHHGGLLRGGPGISLVDGITDWTTEIYSDTSVFIRRQ